MSSTPKKILLTISQAPYGNYCGEEILNVGLMASAFGVNLSLLFIGDGIFQLKKNQQPEHINAKHFTAIFTALDLYDIKQIYATASGLDSRCISAVDLCIPVNIISATALTKLIHQQDVVLNF